MEKSEEARKKTTIELQNHPVRSVPCQNADKGTTIRQNASAPTFSLAVCSPASSSAQPTIEIDAIAAWDIEASIDSVHGKLSELNMERRRKMEDIKEQTLRDAVNRYLIRCCRCGSFAATDNEGSCTECF